VGDAADPGDGDGCGCATVSDAADAQPQAITNSTQPDQAAAVLLRSDEIHTRISPSMDAIPVSTL
jgi:hypothetical protein